MKNVEIEGGILDCCGTGTDAISTVMTAHGFRVATNDLNPMYVRDVPPSETARIINYYVYSRIDRLFQTEVSWQFLQANMGLRS